MVNPSKDGIDHINIYSKAKTALGLFLSNFTEVELETEDGEFRSIEAYWYYLSAPANHAKREELRELSGWQAKQLGRAICGKKDYNADKDLTFQEKIKKAIRYKVKNGPFAKEFAKSTLPFKHYYVYDSGSLEPTEHKWQIEFFEELREEMFSQLPLLEKGL